MYVQIDKEQYESLKSRTIASGVMGSYAHGLEDSQSDIDNLHLYIDETFGNGLFFENNGYQYKSETADENFQELRVFVKNIIIGESPADYECLMNGFNVDPDLKQSSVLKTRIIRLLNDLKSTYSYALIKSYIGYAKKDAKKILEMVDTKIPTDSRELRKKMAHLHRGVITARDLLNKSNYQFSRESTSFIKEINKQIKLVNMYSTYLEIIQFTNEFNSENEFLRKVLNEKLDCGEIHRRTIYNEIQDINNQLRIIIGDYKFEMDIEYHLSSNLDELNAKILQKGVTFQYN